MTIGFEREIVATAITIALLTLPGTLRGQAPAPWIGTWHLNFSKSTSAPGPPAFKRVAVTIQPREGGLKVTYDMVGTRGGITHMEWNGKFDGTDYPVQGVDYVLTNAYTSTGDRSYQIVIKFDGEPVATARVAISPDGKTLTTTTTEKNAQGQSVTTTTVYDKQ